MIRLQIHDQLFAQKNLIIRRELAPVRERILNEIEQLPTQSVVYYDFSDIHAINGSGSDELIAKVIDNLVQNEAPKFLILKNLSEEYEHANEIDSALKKRELAVVHCVEGDHTEFLGKVSEAHREILEIVYRDKVTTARDLADILDKKIALVSTQLAQLYKLRLIRREEDWLSEGGRQFRYMSLC